MDLIVALEDRLLSEKLQHNAPRIEHQVRHRPYHPAEKEYLPSTPHIHFRTIDSSPKQQLGRPIPQSDHPVSIVAPSPFLVETRQTKVTQFKFTAVVDQDV